MLNTIKKFITIPILLLALSGVAYAVAENAKYDENNVPVNLGTTNDATKEARMMRVDTASNYLLVTTSSTPVAITSYLDGRKVVTTAGTAVSLTVATQPFLSCDIMAEESNTGDIMIGASTVDETPASARGVRLIPGANYHFSSAGDLLYIYIDSEVSTNGVTYFCRI